MGCLSATEARKLWRRRKVAQSVVGLFFVGITIALFALNPEHTDVWALLCVAAAAIMCLVHYWGIRYPGAGVRCSVPRRWTRTLPIPPSWGWT